MAISTRVNGVWRENGIQFNRINGVWRESENTWVRVNGVWRESGGMKKINESDIVGFQMIYMLNKERTHPDYPHLKYNPLIPYTAKAAGKNLGTLDTEDKSILFEYTRDEYREEGIICYEGILYALLSNGKVIDVSGITNQIYTPEKIKTYNATLNLTIRMMGYEFYESYGYFVDGWNGLFSSETFLMKQNYPNPLDDKNINRINQCNILPVTERSETYYPNAMIGIARDMSSPDHNMIGSTGTIDHTIHEITVNGVVKPFDVEVYP